MEAGLGLAHAAEATIDEPTSQSAVSRRTRRRAMGPLSRAYICPYLSVSKRNPRDVQNPRGVRISTGGLAPERDRDRERGGSSRPQSGDFHTSKECSTYTGAIHGRVLSAVETLPLADDQVRTSDSLSLARP